MRNLMRPRVMATLLLCLSHAPASRASASFEPLALAPVGSLGHSCETTRRLAGKASWTSTNRFQRTAPFVVRQHGGSGTNCWGVLHRIATSGSRSGAAPISASLGVDAADRLKSVPQGSQPPRSFSYDWAGRLLTALNPESGTTSYRYDLSNNLIWKKDGRGAELCFGGFGSNESCDGSGYDGLNRPVKKRYEAATADWEATPEVTYCYDGQTHDGTQCAGPYVGVEAGRLTGIHNGEARSEFVHDAVGRLLSVKRRLSGLASVPEFSYSYYPGDAMGEMIYPSGRRVRTCVDEWGRDKWVSGVRTMAECAAGVQAVSAESYASSIEYAAGGGLANWNLGTGRTAATAYNERNQPIRMRLGTNLSGTAPCGAQGDDWCIELGYGPVATVNNGNIREQKIWARKADNGYLNLRQTYEFDGLNRLTVVGETVLGGGSSGGNWTETNAYDRWGNRWATSTIPQSFLTPAAPDWIQSATNRVITARATPTTTGTIQYYAGGQVKSHPALGTLWKWDVEGQLRSVDGAQYFYDGEGRRVRKVAGGLTTYFAYDGMGRLGAEYGGSPGTGGVRYLTVDHLGSTRVVTDGSGAVTARCDYSAFGEVLLGTAGVGNRNAIAEYACGQGSVNQKFTGQERDQGPNEWGNDYFLARYYNGAHGRFTSADAPFADQQAGDPQSWNLFSYARNNPFRFVDPTGRDCVEVSGGFSGWADDGKIPFCDKFDTSNAASKIMVGVGRDQANLIMLQGIGENLSSAHQWATVVSGAGQVAMSVVAPIPTVAVQCAMGDCGTAGVAMAMLPMGAGKVSRWGWAGTRKFLSTVRQLKRPGTHEALEGIVPTLEEAKYLIRQAGGTIDRIEDGHAIGGVSQHVYPHINYTTQSGAKATVRVESVK